MDIDGAVAGDATQLRGRAGKRVWKDRLALDQSAVAVGGFFARRTPVQQHDLLAALPQMHGNRYADHPGAKNHHIGLHPTISLHGATAPSSRPCSTLKGTSARRS
jgi:hypothetical protein